MFNKDKFEQIVCPHSENNPRNSEGDIIELKDGRLLLGWSRFTGGYEDYSIGDIGGKISNDGGYTWSEPFTLQANLGKQTTMSVSFLRVKNALLMFYLVKEDIRTDCICYLSKSLDEGKSWEEPVKIFKEPGYYVVNNSRVVLSSKGRIIIPAAYYKNVHEGGAVGLCYYSDDEGKTWSKGRGEVQLEGARSGTEEPGIVELFDGSFMMVIRSEKGYIYKSISNDGCDTWSVPVAMPLVSGASPSTIKRIPDTNKLLLIWNPNVFGKNANWKQRWPLCSAISDDEGETWGNIKYLEISPYESHAYTSISFIKDKVYLTYYQWKNIEGKDNFEGTSLKLKVFNKDWFYS